ncbi:MAG: LPS assembly protein LptD [Pseudomonadota bacterium]|nr:LPS assembly protein LptD [Pseudomonadota bacterium]
MWHKYLIGFLFFGQAYAGLYDELLWQPDHSACAGTFLPLSTDLQHLPDNQTIITTEKESELYLGKEAKLRQVTLNQDGVKMFSENALLTVDKNNKLKSMAFLDLTSYQEEDFIATAKTGNYQISNDRLFLKNLNYRLGALDNIAWGEALKLNRSNNKIFYFKDVNLSFCPPSNPTWVMTSENMTYYPDENLITLDNPGLSLNGTELFKFPFFSFITSGRKSGLLKPEVNYTREYGFMYKQPYYFNLASNYDLVFAPILFTKGSFGFNQLFRYLTPDQNGKFGSEVIWDEREEKRRFQASWQHQYIPWSGNTIGLDITRFSDSNWFRDFGNTFYILDTLHPIERVSMDQVGQWGSASLDVVKYKNDFVTDSSVIPNSEVLFLIPNTLSLNPTWQLVTSLEAGHYYNVQSSNQGAFDASINRVVSGVSFENSIMKPYGFWRNKFAEIIRYYNSDNVKTESSAIPTFSSEAGLFFEKKGANFYQTLTPKVFYVYVPYRSQYDYPIIDASVKSNSNLSSLFSARRFDGVDRVGDENAVVLSLSTMYRVAKGVYEFEMGKQINLESPRLCLNQDCDDGSHAYNPLVINFSGDQGGMAVNANANYDTSLKSFRNVGANLSFKDFLQSDWVIRYAYDLRQQDDSSGEKTDYLSRLGIKQSWYITKFLTINGAIVKDFKDDRFFSYEIGSNYDTCCWLTNINFGRRYIGTSTDSTVSDDDYQWYASIELFLKGFSSRPIINVNKDYHGEEILASI